MPKNSKHAAKQCAGTSTVTEADSSRGLSLITYRKAVQRRCKRPTAHPSGLCRTHRIQKEKENGGE